MKKAREYNKVIVARVNVHLKEKFERYCARNGIGGSEAIRCWIMNLPDEEEKKEGKQQ